MRSKHTKTVNFFPKQKFAVCFSIMALIKFDRKHDGNVFVTLFIP